MGIGSKSILAAGMTKKTSEVEVVFSEDDSIARDLPEALRYCGWIIAPPAMAISSTAWRLTVRGFDPSDFTVFRQICERAGRPHAHRVPPAAAKQAVHTCLKRVEYVDDDGQRVIIKRIKGNEQLDDWIDQLALIGERGKEGFALDLLALVIEAISVGRSVESCYPDARKHFGVEEVDAEPSKSGT